ncbi:PGF-CTERM sorting domain-containing protein [Haloterrigena salina]|uniref:PGF-CTERM sorting domain-containing protein n=1 Tax=Haloterrigena salina TaxID=504937 RepID=UPI001EF9F8B4|nr:PGF-CTERM sorting domain-containing protein [Haloterrigena salina]
MTVTTSDGEPATTTVVFEINGEEIQEEVTASTDDTGSVTFTAEGIALPEGDYEWTITAGDEERSGTLTVTDTADDGATDGTAADGDTETDDDDTTVSENDATADETANNTTTDDAEVAENDTTVSENGTAVDDTTAGNDSEAADNETTASENETGTDDTADNDSETEEEEEESVPGFGVGGALSAVVAGTLLLARRRS